MSGDVLATIKDYVWLIGLLLSIISAYFGGGWGRRGVNWTFALTRAKTRPPPEEAGASATAQ